MCTKTYRKNPAGHVWTRTTSSPSGPAVAFVAFSFRAAIPVCGLHLPVCSSFLVASDRLAGCRLQAVNEEEEESRGVSVCL